MSKVYLFDWGDTLMVDFPDQIAAFFKVVVTTCLIIKQLLFLDSNEPLRSVHSS